MKGKEREELVEMWAMEFMVLYKEVVLRYGLASWFLSLNSHIIKAENDGESAQVEIYQDLIKRLGGSKSRLEMAETLWNLNRSPGEYLARENFFADLSVDEEKIVYQKMEDAVRFWSL